MGTTDAQKAANLRWQAKNTHNFTVKMPNREADALREACARRGVTVHSVFLSAARALIAEDAAKPDADAGTPTP